MNIPNEREKESEVAKDTIWVFCHIQKLTHLCLTFLYLIFRGRRGGDRMVGGCTATYAISAYDHKRYEFEPAHGEVYSIS